MLSHSWIVLQLIWLSNLWKQNLEKSKKNILNQYIWSTISERKSSWKYISLNINQLQIFGYVILSRHTKYEGFSI